MQAHSFSCAPASIRPYVVAMWQVAGAPPYGQESILPKGVIELIFSFGEPLLLSQGPGAALQATPQCFISGLSTQPLHLRAPAYQHLFGVQLTPLGVRKLLRVPAGELLNSITDLHLLHPQISELAAQLAEAAGFEQRVGIIGHWAGQQLAAVAPQDQLIAAYLQPEQPALETVIALADRACYSPRQLSRKARDFFGLPAEALLRYKRYLRALGALHQPAAGLLDAGLASGYYDQAHFNREFRHFTGLTPGAYRRQQSARPGHVYQ